MSNVANCNTSATSFIESRYLNLAASLGLPGRLKRVRAPMSMLATPRLEGLMPALGLTAVSGRKWAIGGNAGQYFRALAICRKAAL